MTTTQKTVDIAPELLKSIQSDFEGALAGSKELKALGEAIENRTASYEDATRYAREVSKLCAESVKKFLTSEALPDGKLYYNIAEKVMKPMLRDTRLRVSRYCYEVQRILNRNVGVNLQPAEPERNEERLEGLVQHASDLGVEDLEQALQFTGSATETFDCAIVDEYVETNARRHAGMGLHSYVVRTAHAGCCAWCQKLAGRYEYDGDSRHEYWKRHVGCTCTLSFESARGASKTVWDPSIHRQNRRRR